jgi:hypothetical protein
VERPYRRIRWRKALQMMEAGATHAEVIRTLKIRKVSFYKRLARDRERLGIGQDFSSTVG